MPSIFGTILSKAANINDLHGDFFLKALKWGEKAVHQNPKNILSRVILCSIYSLADRMDEARAQAKEIMKINPKFSVDRFARTDPQKNQVVKKRYIDALRNAGFQ